MALLVTDSLGRTWNVEAHANDPFEGEDLKRGVLSGWPMRAKTSEHVRHVTVRFNRDHVVTLEER